MREECGAEGLHQASRSSGVACADALVERSQQHLARISEEIFPLKQFGKRSGYGRLIFLFFGPLLIYGSFPGAPRLEKRTPAIEPRFCASKELIHSNFGSFCCRSHDCSPSLALCDVQDGVALNSVGCIIIIDSSREDLQALISMGLIDFRNEH